MLGILGILIFGGVFTGAWVSAEQSERKNKINSKHYSNDIYIDKWGNRRHGKTGKKYTSEESKRDTITDRHKRIMDKYNIYVKIKKQSNKNSIAAQEIISFEEWYKNRYGVYPRDDKFWNM